MSVRQPTDRPTASVVAAAAEPLESRLLFAAVPTASGDAALFTGDATQALGGSVHVHLRHHQSIR